MKILFIVLCFLLFLGFTYSLDCSNAQTFYGYNLISPAGLTIATPRSGKRGTRFSSAVDGVIVGIKFYLGGGDGLSGTFTGAIYDTSATNQLSSTITFTGAAPVGWQIGYFSQPFTVTAGTPYVVLVDVFGNF